jgi:hypothetical protein
MRWLLQRVLALWFIMLALCGVVALLVRLNREPGPLEALGFDGCDGAPCFRRISVGAIWSETYRAISEANENSTSNVYIRETVDRGIVTVSLLSDGKTVGRIALQPDPASRLSVADIMQRFGYPCVAFVVPEDVVAYSSMILTYPKFEVTVFLQNSRLAMDSLVSMLSLREPPDSSAVCNISLRDEGPWRGFTSASVYLARNRRTLGAK